MAYIKVDHRKLESTASEIETYITYVKSRMDAAGDEVKALSNNWQGEDYKQFISQWDTVTAGGSTYDNMIKSFESYAKFLRFAAGKYKDAQAKAINRANSLPRW